MDVFERLALVFFVMFFVNIFGGAFDILWAH